MPGIRLLQQQELKRASPARCRRAQAWAARTDAMARSAAQARARLAASPAGRCTRCPSQAMKCDARRIGDRWWIEAHSEHPHRRELDCRLLRSSSYLSSESREDRVRDRVDRGFPQETVPFPPGNGHRFPQATVIRLATAKSPWPSDPLGPSLFGGSRRLPASPAPCISATE